MDKNTKIQISLAIGWFVLLDVLLRTSSASLNALSVTTGSLRGVLGSLLYGSQWSVTVSAPILALVGWLALLLIVSVLRVWAKVIEVTRNIVQWLLLDGEENSLEKRSELLTALFGKDALESRTSLIWRLFRDLMIIWFLLLLFQLVTSVISGMYSF